MAGETDIGDTTLGPAGTTGPADPVPATDAGADADTSTDTNPIDSGTAAADTADTTGGTTGSTDTAAIAGSAGSTSLPGLAKKDTAADLALAKEQKDAAIAAIAAALPPPGGPGDETGLSAEEIAAVALPEFKSEDEMTDDELDNEVFLDDEDEEDEPDVATAATSEDKADDGTVPAGAAAATALPATADGSADPAAAEAIPEPPTKEELAKAQIEEAKAETENLVKNQAKAKKKAAKQAETKALRSAGFARTRGGYQFPNVDPAAVELAAKKRLLLKKKQKDGTAPKVKPAKMGVKPMDQEGNFNIDMSKPMMAPEGDLDQGIYGSAFGMGCESGDDGSTTAGTFGEPKTAAAGRRLAVAEATEPVDGAAKLGFRPVVSRHDENGIVIKIEFDDPDAVSSTGAGAMDMKVKAVSIFKTKETMTSLNNNAFKGGKPELGGAVPPIISDPWEANMIKTNSKYSTDWLNLFNAGNFFIMLILGGTMRQLWGMIRTVQMVTFSTVVNVKLPLNLFIFLRLYVYFAMMDVLQGRELYKSILKF